MKACDVVAAIVSAISGSAQDEKLIEDLTQSLELCLRGEIDYRPGSSRSRPAQGRSATANFLVSQVTLAQAPG